MQIQKGSGLKYDGNQSKIEDQASKKPLSQVVPEWAPYFE